MLFLNPSQRRFLSSLNPVLLGGLVYILIIFRTTSEATMPTVLRQWELLLPFVIYVGQRRALLEGVLLVLFMTHLYSLNSVAPIGVFAIHYVAIFFAARLLIYAVYANTWTSILTLIFLLSFASRILLPLIADGFGHGWAILSWRNIMLGSLFINSGLGLVTYWALALIDKVTYKVAPINIELGGDEV